MLLTSSVSFTFYICVSVMSCGASKKDECGGDDNDTNDKTCSMSKECKTEVGGDLYGLALDDLDVKQTRKKQRGCEKCCDIEFFQHGVCCSVTCWKPSRKQAAKLRGATKRNATTTAPIDLYGEDSSRDGDECPTHATSSLRGPPSWTFTPTSLDAAAAGGLSAAIYDDSAVESTVGDTSFGSALDAPSTDTIAPTMGVGNIATASTTEIVAREKKERKAAKKAQKKAEKKHKKHAKKYKVRRPTSKPRMFRESDSFSLD